MDPTTYYCVLVFWLVVLLWLLRVPKPYEENIMGRLRAPLAWRFSLPVGLACSLSLFGFQLWLLGNKMKGVSPGEVNPPATDFGYLLQALLLAPLLEEMIFRGLLFRRLKDTRIGFFPSLLLSSGFFSLLHSHSVDAFAVAIVLCLLVYNTGNAWPGVAVHGLNNLVNLVPRIFWRSIPETVLTHLHFTGALFIVAFSPGFAILAHRSYRRFRTIQYSFASGDLNQKDGQ